MIEISHFLVENLEIQLKIDQKFEFLAQKSSFPTKISSICSESLSTLTSASLPKCRIHRTRENVMLGVRDLSNVLEIISAAQRQWDLNEKKEKVAAVHAAATIGGRSGLDGQQRSGYSRYAQEAFAHVSKMAENGEKMEKIG